MPTSKTTWIVAADSSRARVLQRAGPARPLVAIEDLSKIPRDLSGLTARELSEYFELGSSRAL